MFVKAARDRDCGILLDVGDIFFLFCMMTGGSFANTVNFLCKTFWQDLCLFAADSLLHVLIIWPSISTGFHV